MKREMIIPIDLIALFFLVVIALAAIAVRDLLAAVVLLSAYSFIMATVWVEMHAVDVGFTEAAVGAGATTAFMIATLAVSYTHLTLPTKRIV